MTENKPTGNAVRDTKGGTTGKKPAPGDKKQVQIHAGNLGVVQTQLLSEINQSLAVLAACCKIWFKENPPKQEKNNG
jgi:hypothetical protein